MIEPLDRVIPRPRTPRRVPVVALSATLCALLIGGACSAVRSPTEPTVAPVVVETRAVEAPLPAPEEAAAEIAREPSSGLPEVREALDPVDEPVPVPRPLPTLPVLVRVGLSTDRDVVQLDGSQGQARLETQRHVLDAQGALRIRSASEPKASAFRVQVAAVKDELQAQGIAADLAARLKVVADAVFDAGTDLYKVRVGRFAEERDADHIVATLAGLGFESTWTVREFTGAAGAAFLVDVGPRTYRLDGRRLEIRGDAGFVTWEGRRFRGDLEVYLNDRGLLNVINRLDLEEYLQGVVPKELGPSQYPRLEALKAQAIAARTYTLRNLGEFSEEGYDICGTPRCQVYGGILNEHPLSNRAIQETASQVLVHRGELVDSLYSATCGGHTENVAVVFPEKDYPYLRGKPCVEGGTRSASPGDRELAATLMPRVLAGDASDPTARLEQRLRQLAQRAGLPVPEDRLGSLRAPEVRRFVASLFDLVVDARVFADAVDLSALLEEPPAGWSNDDLGLASYFAGSGWVDVRESGALPAVEQEELLFQLAQFVRLLEVETGHFRRRSGTSLVMMRDGDPTSAVGDPVEASYELPQGTPFFRRRGDDVLRATAELRDGDPLEVVREGDRIVCVVQAGAGLPTTGRRQGRSPWTRFRSDGQLASLVGEKHPGLVPEQLEVLSRGVSGRVRELAVTGVRDGIRERVVVRGLAVRWLVDVPDTLFTVQRVRPPGRSAGWLFKGRGWGHGVGMCQIGAVGMARDGSDHRQILQHYYSGVDLRRLDELR